MKTFYSLKRSYNNPYPYQLYCKMDFSGIFTGWGTTDWMMSSDCFALSVWLRIWLQHSGRGLAHTGLHARDDADSVPQLWGELQAYFTALRGSGRRDTFWGRSAPPYPSGSAFLFFHGVFLISISTESLEAKFHGDLASVFLGNKYHFPQSTYRGNERTNP